MTTATPRRLSRRHFLELVTAGAATVGGGYSLLFEPSDFAVEHVSIAAPLPTGLRIGAISDFHLADHISQQRVQTAVDLLRTQATDLIVLLGDYSTAMHTESVIHRNVERALEILATLNAPLGVYAILGNHDVSRKLGDIARLMEQHGAIPLIDSTAILSLHGERFGIVGLADALRMRPNPSAALAALPPNVSYLGLVHEPDAAPSLLPRAALVLSGHSHGGQVQLPLIGAPVLPKLGRRFPWGLRRDGDTLIYTSRGVGMVPPRIRINCRPEVTLITIVNEGGQPPLPPHG